MPKRKNPAAVSLGRRGGKARARKMTPDDLTAHARKMLAARWRKAKRTK